MCRSDAASLVPLLLLPGKWKITPGTKLLCFTCTGAHECRCTLEQSNTGGLPLVIWPKVDLLCTENGPSILVKLKPQLLCVRISVSYNLSHPLPGRLILEAVHSCCTSYCCRFIAEMTSLMKRPYTNFLAIFWIRVQGQLVLLILIMVIIGDMYLENNINRWNGRCKCAK